MLIILRAKQILSLIALIIGAWVSTSGQRHSDAAAAAEARAVAFLTRETPAWSKENGCFSCHNNGDAARALYAASRKGYRLPVDVLAETTAWVSQPASWDENKGDPGFSDQRLANIQFAAALLAANETGHVNDQPSLRAAARKLIAAQEPDGAWHIEQDNTLGSPATYGTHLATHLALTTLRRADLAATKNAEQKAEQWLSRATPNNVPAAAALLLAAFERTDRAARLQQTQCLKLLRAAQTRDGGWGPYADAPPEAFDTALALLALIKLRRQPGIAEAIARGRSFLSAQQNADGGWPATTRPAGGDSYAQRVSTTAWATLALLATRK